MTNPPRTRPTHQDVPPLTDRSFPQDASPPQRPSFCPKGVVLEALVSSWAGEQAGRRVGAWPGVGGPSRCTHPQSSPQRSPGRCLEKDSCVAQCRGRPGRQQVGAGGNPLGRKLGVSGGISVKG